MKRERVFDNPKVIEDVWVPRKRGGKLPSTSRIIPINSDKIFKKQLIDAVDNASHQIFLCSFLLADNDLTVSLENAANRGVRVYLMMASEAQLGKEDLDKDYNYEHVKQHKDMLKRLEKKVLIRDADHLHAKLLVTDPFDGGKAFLSTANFTKEALERNQELGVELPSANALFSIFRYGFWNEAKRESDGKGRYVPFGGSLRAPPPEYGNILLADLTESRMIKDEIVSILQTTEGPVTISTYGLDHDSEVFREIEKRAMRDKVTVFIRPRMRNLKAVRLLSRLQNVTVLSFRWLHAKFILASNRGLIITANFDNRLDSDDPTFEVGVVLDNVMIQELHKITKYWIENAEYHYFPSVRLSDIQADFVSILKESRLTDIKVQKEQVIERSGELDLREYLNWKNSEISLGNDRPNSRRIRVVEEYLPMKLPKGAILVKTIDDLPKKTKNISGHLFKDGNTPPLYKHSGTLFYAVEKEKIPTVKLDEKIKIVVEE